MGAEPAAYVLNLTLPARTNKEWLSSFADGLRVDQSAFGVRLLGGILPGYQEISHRDGDVRRGAEVWRDHQGWSACRRRYLRLRNDWRSSWG